jgi:uncharacterized protein YoaH (UPF0181 family)
VVSRTLRNLSSVIFIIGLVLAVGHVVTAAGQTDGPLSLARLVRVAGPAFGLLAVAWTLASVLWLIAQGPAETSAGIDKQALLALEQRIAELQQQVLQSQQQRGAAGPASAAELTPNALGEEVLAELREVRALLLMSEPQRQAVIAQMAAQRRDELVRDTRSAIEQRRWSQARENLAALRQEYAADAEIEALETSFNSAQAALEQETAAQAVAQIEDLMAMGQWEQALERAQAFAAEFASSPQAQAMVARVTRERDLHVDVVTRQLWDEVKRQAERRMWRKALAAARRLSEQYSAHKLAQRVQQQLPTLEENAQIEERQEQEDHIHSLVGRKRYAEAIELAEQLMDKYPSSPQALTLRDLLPKLREKVLEEEITRG